MLGCSIRRAPYVRRGLTGRAVAQYNEYPRCSSRTRRLEAAQEAIGERHGPYHNHRRTF